MRGPGTKNLKSLASIFQGCRRGEFDIFIFGESRVDRYDNCSKIFCKVQRVSFCSDFGDPASVSQRVFFELEAVGKKCTKRRVRLSVSGRKDVMEYGSTTFCIPHGFQQESNVDIRMILCMTTTDHPQAK